MAEFSNGLPAHDAGQFPRPPAYPPRTNPFAVASFVLAFFMTLLSIIFGHIALNQIKRTGEQGRGLALAGLWISYLSIVAAVVAIAIVWGMAVSAQNSFKSSMSYDNNYSSGTETYGYAPAPVATDPAYMDPGTTPFPEAAPSAVGPAGVPQPMSSVPSSNADRAYCQNRGVLLWLADSATFRGALCSIDNAPMLVSMSRDIGGTVVLAATAEQDNYHAVAQDGTVYTFDQNSITVATPAKTFEESTTLWAPGTSPTLSSPGDLGLSTPISYPACDGSAIVVYGTSWTPATDASEIQKLLDSNPGSSYMRTDLSCRSFRGPSTANSGEEDVYAVYSSSPNAQTACQQIAGTSNYGRILSNQRAPGDNDLGC